MQRSLFLLALGAVALIGCGPVIGIRPTFVVGSSNNHTRWVPIVVDSLDQPLSGAAYRLGQSATVAWSVPVPDRGESTAYAGVSERCGAEPTFERWFVTGINAGEAFLVGDVRNGGPGRNTVSALHALQLESEVQLYAGERITWLIHLPPGKKRHLVATASSRDPSRDLLQPPCPIVWKKLSVGSYVSSTVQESSGSQSPNNESGLDATSIARAKASLGFIGAPAYDLTLLHSHVLQSEVNGSALAADPLILRAMRSEILDALMSSGEKGVADLCYIGTARGVFSVKLKAWDGDSTIPTAFASRCRDRI